jgi:hypothetical protein
VLQSLHGAMAVAMQIPSLMAEARHGAHHAWMWSCPERFQTQQAPWAKDERASQMLS